MCTPAAAPEAKACQATIRITATVIITTTTTTTMMFIITSIIAVTIIRMMIDNY